MHAMNDPSPDKTPSDGNLSPAEDESRFAPKPEGNEKNNAAAKQTGKRPEPSPDVISNHAEEEEKEKGGQEDDAQQAKSDALFWNLCLGLAALIVIGAGYIVYEKFSQLPNPVKEARETLAANQALLLEKQTHLKAVRDKTIPKEQLLRLLDIFEKTAGDLEDTQKSIEKEKMRVAGIRGEIRSYYDRYRQFARAKARGRKFDILRTVHSGKTYLNVEITRVENEFVRITHEQGSTSIPAGDLSDEMRELLAYGDPLNITAMNQADANLQPPVIERRPAPMREPAPAPVQPKKKVVVENLDPPSGNPRIETPTHTDDSTAPASGNIWVPPAHSPLPPM